VTKRRLSEGDCYPSELNPRSAFGFVAASVTSLRMASRAVCVATAASLHALARSLADRRAASSFLSFQSWAVHAVRITCRGVLPRVQTKNPQQALPRRANWGPDRTIGEVNDQIPQTN